MRGLADGLLKGVIVVCVRVCGGGESVCGGGCVGM